MLAGYEQRLQEYLEAFDGDTSGMLEDGYDEMLDELYEYNEKDDGYEGDLHLSIGALYMAQGGDNNLFAASHLEQAVRLYELSGERDGENTATAKFNLSILHLRGGDYRASAQLHGEALDIFRSVNEENVSLTGLLGVNELRTLMIQHPQRQESSRNDDQPSPSTKAKAASPATQTTTTTTRESHSSIKETKPSLQAAADHSDGPSILIDVNSFLNQNNSLKEEL